MNNLIRKLVLAAKAKIAELSDNAALEYKELYPQWESRIGKSVAIGDRLYYDDKLWKVLQAHTCQENWTPDVTTSLFTQIMEGEQGTIDNPIPFSLNMELVQGKYYTEDNVKYLCIRELTQCVWHLNTLVGNYVQEVSN